MRLGMRNRCLASLVAVGYLLTVSAASLFHNHGAADGGGCCHERSTAHAASADEHHGSSHDHEPHHKTPKSPSGCPADDGRCSVCQYLAQKPVPTAEVAPVGSGTLIEEVLAPPPARLSIGAFWAWHSRGPPALV
jgi:hypothetical protein